MDTEYEISEQDFINAQRLAVKESPVHAIRWTRLVLPLFGTGLLAFLIHAVVQQGLSWRMVPGLAFCLYMISLPFWSRRAQKRLYAKATAMHGRISLGVGEDGLQFQGPTFSSQLRWSHFARFIEDEDSFLLYPNEQIFNIVPKRNLAPEQITALREYLALKIGPST